MLTALRPARACSLSPPPTLWLRQSPCLAFCSATARRGGQERHEYNDRGDLASIKARKESIESVGLLWELKGPA
eukprot:1310542-Pyramimonas_sp.AAC.1